MRKLSGWLYGHYDSRGGTTFVVADNVADADRKYSDDFGQGDRMQQATLWVPDDFDLERMHGQDLEGPDRLEFKRLEAEIVAKHPNNWEKYTDPLWALPPLGKVLAPGSTTSMADLADGEGDLDLENHVTLEFVPTGAEPQVLRAFSHPRWDDDAFSFGLVVR